MDHAGTSRTPELEGVNRRTILALLVLVYTFNFIDRMIVATLGQAIEVDLQITDAQLGLLQGLAFAIFFTTPASRWRDSPSALARQHHHRLPRAVVWHDCTLRCGWKLHAAVLVPHGCRNR